MKRIAVILASGPLQIKQCREVRQKVFIEEQGVPAEIEIDDFEDSSLHFLASVEGRAVGTGRLRLKKSYAKFERIASLKEVRGQGVGRALMDFMQAYAESKFPQYLPAMHAQKSAVGFYLKLGWVPVGDEFYEAEIAHRLLIYPPKDMKQLRALKAWSDQETTNEIRAYLETLLGDD